MAPRAWTSPPTGPISSTRSRSCATRSRDGGFRVVYDLHPDALDFEWSGTDGGFRADAVYYLRLRQRSQVRGRIVMAWSSPIWVRGQP